MKIMKDYKDLTSVWSPNYGRVLLLYHDQAYVHQVLKSTRDYNMYTL